MTTEMTYKNLEEFLSKHKTKKDDSSGNPVNLKYTHTRIGDKKLGIFAGSYHIPDDAMNIFYKLYYDHIFLQEKFEHLTEKQLEENGPIMIDIDLRYDMTIDKRQHTKEHISDIICLYLDKLKEFFIFNKDTPFPIYVMEKENINVLEEKQIVKDGVHMIIGLQMDHIMQQMLREKIIESIADIWELPITNTWDSVFDEGISKGITNWQLYGSRKPAHDAYQLTQYYIASFDDSDNEFMLEEQSINSFQFEKDLCKLSARYSNHPSYQMNPNIEKIYNERKGIKQKKISTKVKVKYVPNDNFILEEDEDEDNMDKSISIHDIRNKESLNSAVKTLIKSLKPCEYYIKETHEYTQILPEKYYQPGSHYLNRKVAFALKHTSEKLFLSWVMLRSKAEDFDYSSIPKLHHDWKSYFNTKGDSHNSPITRRTIIYWAKQDAYDEYVKVKSGTIDHYIEETLLSPVPTEFDFAMVLYQMFKDQYVCSSLVNKTWYTFKDHRWQQDRGQSLRLAISRDMFNLYNDKLLSHIFEMNNSKSNNTDLQNNDKKNGNAINAVNGLNDENDYYSKLQMKCQKIANASNKLKKTNDKNNIMREAMELFYDNDFVKNMDINKHLMCFTNGVIDFKTKTFRDGYPQDYITKTTGIPYITYSEEHQPIKREIVKFMEQLFPNESLNKYFWEHMASNLIGSNINQTFHMYLGNGSNGKSILIDIMTQILGEYKGTVPITLITEKRNSIGGTSSEIILLKGTRLAVMQEPSKDMKINEGIMKELTGDDPIQGRQLYCESETFKPQFNLVVCTNNLPEINSNDDGTWRRIRIVPFMSKFVDDVDNKIYKNTQHVFPKDKSLKDKFPIWAPVFASMLVDIAFKTEGNVADCDIVMEHSNKYRQNQDHIAAFVREMVVEKEGKSLKKTELTEQFKLWFQENQGARKMPKGVELHDYMTSKYGDYKASKGWMNVTINYPTEDDDEM
jgi:P4 family phage/plasmid primase-like protien